MSGLLKLRKVFCLYTNVDLVVIVIFDEFMVFDDMLSIISKRARICIRAI